MDSHTVFATLADGVAVDLTQIVAYFDSRCFVEDVTKALKHRMIIDLCTDGKKTTKKTVILTRDNVAYIVGAEVESVNQLMRENGFIIFD